ncbi:mechanosensitive ion channel family protein [Miniphocaeibacter massiliensis]|uniref:mechanosensitive ion channel family protein n=1 Tax=Miniphocaeibacter massiliensis TaxID=2041841 RepID=UPI000C1B8CED|nr:mechanosensitive ion channel family protein [Miniphocaeibacter massiliensis]
MEKIITIIEKIKSIFYTENNTLNIFGKLTYALVVFIIATIIVKLIHKVFKKVLEKNSSKLENKLIDVKKSMTITSVINNALKYIIYFFAIMQVLDKFGFNTGYIVGAAGIGGVALGFGAQSLVKDVISGIFIIFEGQYEIGDNILINNIISGNVVEFGMKTTKIKGFDGSITTIGNGNITTVKNMSKGNQRAYVEITVPEFKDINEVENIVNSITEKIGKDKNVTVKPYLLGITDIGISNSIKIAIIAWTKPGKQATVEIQIRELFIKEALKKEIEVEN